MEQQILPKVQIFWYFPTDFIKPDLKMCLTKVLFDINDIYVEHKCLHNITNAP